tara:strand:- start:18066 stop:18920 length:855 start_codon:yes stop_codon:yes gene_type:complete
MTAATSPATTKKTPDPASLAVQIADSQTLYHGRFVGLRGPEHATSQGDAANYEDEAGMIFGGVAANPGGLSSAAGDSSGTPPPKVGVSLVPEILKAVTVAGASAITDQWKPVFATDNATLTLTRPADDAEAVGVIARWITSTSCDVLLFGLPHHLRKVGEREFFPLGTYDNTDLNDGDILTGLVMPFAGKFISLHGAVETPFTGASGTATVNLEIGGTNLTGGTLVVSTAAGGTAGTILDAAAITDANVFHDGDVVDVEVASAGGTQTAGRVRIFALIERLPGA